MIRILAGDVGGTHLRLGIVEHEDGSWRMVAERNLSSHDYAGLLPAVQDFLRSEQQPERVCIGVPGPVEEGRARLSNLDWTVDAAALARGTGIDRVRIINDFEAIGHAIPHLGREDLVELQAGAPEASDPPAPLAVIGPGTGLGQGFLVWADGRYRPFPSEGGHTDFAPESPVEYELHAHLRRRHGHVSAERVVSGPGLVATYEFLVERAGQRPHPAIQQALNGGDAAAAISQLGLRGDDLLSADALGLMVRTLARQAGSFVLALRATGGVYLAGGIAPKILPALRDGTFLDTFRDKGRMSGLLADVPIHVIVAPHVGLLGAAAATLE